MNCKQLCLKGNFLNYFAGFSMMKNKKSYIAKCLLHGIFTMVVLAGLSACGSKEKKPGQTLARVDGEEITILQLNDELQRANIQPGHEDEARKQLLESLIDRQLVIDEAKRNKIDRTPDVMKDIERAKMQIISEAYIDNITAKITKPSKLEIEEYYQKNPELFSRRKQFDLTDLQVPTQSFDGKFKAEMSSARSLNEVIGWLDKNGIQYTSSKLSRTSADISPDMVEKLKALPKGRLIIVEEGPQTMILSLDAVRERPVALKDASQKIERHLVTVKSNEIVNNEIAHLRSLAKIEYLNVPAKAKGTTKPVIQDAGTMVKGR